MIQSFKKRPKETTKKCNPQRPPSINPEPSESGNKEMNSDNDPRTDDEDDLLIPFPVLRKTYASLQVARISGTTSTRKYKLIYDTNLVSSKA